MRKRRLLKLVSLLEADAANKTGSKFDLSAWGSSSDPTAPLTCGTYVCAMGLAALSGSFKRLRAEINTDDDDHYEVEIVYESKDGAIYYSTEAAEQAFGLTQREAFWLFYEQAYIGNTTGKRAELAVAKRIRNFVAGKDAPPLSLAV